MFLRVLSGMKLLKKMAVFYCNKRKKLIISVNDAGLYILRGCASPHTPDR